MTNEERVVETEDSTSLSGEDSQATLERAEDTSAEDVQTPEQDIRELPDEETELEPEAVETADEDRQSSQEESSNQTDTPVKATDSHVEQAETRETEEELSGQEQESAQDTGELPEQIEEVLQENEPAEEDSVDVQEEDSEVQAEVVEQVEQAQQEPHEPEETPTVESVIEAILFATDEPLTESRLAGIVETTGKQVRESVASLNARYEAGNNAFRIEQIAGGYQMLTLPLYNHWLKKMVSARSDSKLSSAALETLAIIAYKQPIIRADIEAIRGVAAGEVIRSLMYKGLVKIAGRAEVLGRPMLYGTTKKFLEVFGLNSLRDLPKAEELKNPDR